MVAFPLWDLPLVRGYSLAGLPRWWSICLPVQEMWIQSLGLEDAVEEEMATRSSILAWRIPWTEEPGGLWAMESQRVRHNWAIEQAFTNKETSPPACWFSLALQCPKAVSGLQSGSLPISLPSHPLPCSFCFQVHCTPLSCPASALAFCACLGFHSE